MRVISLVPSITETLIECGVEVVGRTRFCIHPAEQVKHIRAVGGTKGVNWQKCADLLPDLVIFEKEENREEMASSCPYEWMAIHVASADDLPGELSDLAKILGNQPLANLAHEWSEVLAQSDTSPLTVQTWADVPAQIALLKSELTNYKRVEYVIWRDPWMAVSADTFVGSMLARLGFAEYLPRHTDKYPVLSESDMLRDDTFYLFSSEPYRFTRYVEELKTLGINGAVVDGEVYSWFGVRSLRALQQHRQAFAHAV